jgi:hypothetical protein
VHGLGFPASHRFNSDFLFRGAARVGYPLVRSDRFGKTKNPTSHVIDFIYITGICQDEWCVIDVQCVTGVCFASMVFIETPVFTEQVSELLTDEEYSRLQLHLAIYPKAGDVIEGTGGLRKVRWKSSTGGKRGGYRVIYFFAASQDQVRLLLIYPKGKKDDLSAKEKKILRRLNEDW